jgi:anti-anti-sigma factor
MPETAKPVYLVDAYSDPVVIRVEGRASFQNSASMHDFIAECIRKGKTRFVVDFQKCESMDSTFLGVLAGAAVELRKPGATAPQNTSGSLVFARMSQRNLELARNLGLHHLATIDRGDFPMHFGAPCAPLSPKALTEIEHAKLALEAHENLLDADESNRAKFQDVVAFLKNRVEQK